MARTATLFVLMLASACDLTTPPAVGAAQDPLDIALCAAPNVTPTLSSAAVVGPGSLDRWGALQPGVSFTSTAGRFERTHEQDGEPNDLEYVSGNYVEARLVVDSCAYLEEVKLGNQVLTGSPVNGNWFLTSSTVLADGTRQILVWIEHPSVGDGATDLARITVGEPNSSATTAYEFRLVRVAEVRPSSSNLSDPNADVRVGISQAELANSLRQGLYDEFNGGANQAFEQGTRLYGLDPNVGLTVDSTGAHLDFRFYADTFCQPLFHVHGTFNIDTGTQPSGQPGIVFTWPEPITAIPDWSFTCSLVDLVPLAGQLVLWAQNYFIAGPAQDSVRASIEARLQQLAPPTSPIVQALLHHGGADAGELYINLHDALGPQIHIDVPYVSPLEGVSPQLPARKPTALPKTLPRMLLAHGIGLPSFQSGPNGLPNTTPGFPTLDALWRYPVSSLPDMLASPAQLIAVSGYDHYAYTPGCQLPPSTTSVVLAVNDTSAGASQLRASQPTGSYRAVLIFGGANGLTASCPDYNSAPIIYYP